MGAVGLVRRAHVAREVAETVLPTYRSTYSEASLYPAVAIGHPLPDAL
jgi:hypothetical protein